MKSESLVFIIVLFVVIGLTGGLVYAKTKNTSAQLNDSQTADTTSQENKDMDNQNTNQQSAFSDLIKEDTTLGTGALAEKGKTLTVNYTGKLLDGTIFDSSLKPGRTPFQFTLGAGQVIQGWDLGFEGMQVGGKRLLKIPSRLAYGSRGAGDLIKPNSDLIFEVELLDVK